MSREYSRLEKRVCKKIEKVVSIGTSLHSYQSRVAADPKNAIVGWDSAQRDDC